MAIYDWPAYGTDDAFWPQSVELVQWHNGFEHTSRLSGDVQTQGTPGSRWGWRLNFGPQTWARRNRLLGFLTRLKGKQHRVRLFALHQPNPVGLIKTFGVTLGASAAQFAESLVLTGCRGENLLLGGSFESDGSADGLADQWLLVANGTVGTVTPALSVTGAAVAPTRVQQLSCTNLGTTNNDYVGVWQTVPVSGLGGQPFTLSAWFSADVASLAAVEIDWRDVASAPISLPGSSQVMVPVSAMVRISVSGTIPANAATGTVYLTHRARPGAAGAAIVNFDAAQLELAAVPSAYKAPATVKSGDWLSVAGQPLMIVDDAIASDIGFMTVAVRHSLRAAASSGAAVTLSSPTGLYILTTNEFGVAFDGEGRAPPLSIEFREVFS